MIAINALEVTAQETTTSANTSDASQTATETISLGQKLTRDSVEIGATYVTEIHGDWARRCIKSEDNNDQCHLFQLLNDEQGQPITEVTMVPLINQGDAVALLNVVTPLETLLTAQLTIDVDGVLLKRYPFVFCARIGCVSRIGLTLEEIEIYKKGSQAVLTMIPFAAPDTPVQTTMSLKGFTAGYNDLGNQ